VDPADFIGEARISPTLATDVFDMIAPSCMLRRSSRTHSLLLLLGSAVGGSAFSACSGTSYYDLCSDDCGSGGSAGSASPASGGSHTGGSSGNGSGGNAGAPASDGNGGTGAEGGEAVASGGTADASGGESGSGGQAGEGGSTEPAPECNPMKSPTDEPCLLSDSFAVFARSDATDGDGSEKSPRSSLADAIVQAEREGKIVIACGGLYSEPLELIGLDARTRLRVFGGFTCNNTDGEWTGAGSPTKVQPAEGAALHLDDVHDITFTDLQFLAAPAQTAGDNSIAAIIEGSKGIELERVSLIASNGEDGANGAATPARAAKAPNGNPPQASAGANPQTDCPCESSGGGGGDRADTSTSNGGDGLPALGAGAGGKGGSTCLPGGAGMTPEPSATGFGASSLGALVGAAWQPADGEPGEAGTVGQGGGGGGGDTNGYGGGGACGGCGGGGGEAGRGGGASIGLILLGSEVAMTECTITTGNGGNGGAGRPGQPGQPGGDGGPSTSACIGGNGGSGGDGGPGGGGAGGISVGIVHRDAEAKLDDLTTFNLGDAGDGGDGGGTDNHGLPGERVEQLPIGS
jgi:hypothetical protein